MITKIAVSAALLALVMTAPASSANTGLVGQWRLDEGQGGVASDSSGFGDNGTIQAGVSWTSGRNGAALSFDGVTGRVRVPDAPQLEPSTSVTAAAWVARVGSPGAYKYVLAKGGSGCIAASYGLYSGPSGGLEFYVSRARGATYARSADAGAGVWDGHWHLAVGTFDGTAIRLYVDGTEVGVGTVYPGPIEYLLSSANDLFIGAYPSCPNESFDGTISDVRIWGRALSGTEVASLSTANQQPPTGGADPPSAAGPSGETTRSGGSAGSTGGTRMSNLPVIRMARMSPSRITVGSNSAPAGRSPLILYTDTSVSQVTFTILRVQGKAARTQCMAAARRRHHAAVAYCPRYVALGRFVHQDRRGRNVVRFPRPLTPPLGSYVLDLTPSLNGDVGRTVGIPFKVVAPYHAG